MPAKPHRTTISLSSPELAAHLESRAERLGYHTFSAYVEALCLWDLQTGGTHHILRDGSETRYKILPPDDTAPLT